MRPPRSNEQREGVSLTTRPLYQRSAAAPAGRDRAPDSAVAPGRTGPRVTAAVARARPRSPPGPTWRRRAPVQPMAAAPGRRARPPAARGRCAGGAAEPLPLLVAERGCQRAPGPPLAAAAARFPARRCPPARRPARPSPQVGGRRRGPRTPAARPARRRPSPARRAPAAASCSRAAGNGRTDGRRAGEGRRPRSPAAARSGSGWQGGGAPPRGARAPSRGEGLGARPRPRPGRAGGHGRARAGSPGSSPIRFPRGGGGLTRGGGAAPGSGVKRGAAPFHPMPACISVDQITSFLVISLKKKRCFHYLGLFR